MLPNAIDNQIGRRHIRASPIISRGDERTPLCMRKRRQVIIFESSSILAEVGEDIAYLGRYS